MWIIIWLRVLDHYYIKVTVKNVCLLQVRLQSQSSVLSGNEKYTLDQFAVSDVKSVLRDQQQAIQVKKEKECTSYTPTPIWETQTAHGVKPGEMI